MDENSFKTNMDTLKEMLLDEEKLVTYVSLSKELCVHVNDSKKLLTRLAEEIKKKPTDIKLHVSYIISGLCDKNKARTLVLPEQELATYRNKLKIVFFEHIYSVSKGNSTADTVALLATNKLDDFPLCTGLIKGNSCCKRSIDELCALKSNSQISVVTVHKPVILPQKKIKEEPKNLVQNLTKNSLKFESNNSEPKVKKESPSPRKEQSNDTKAKTDNKKNAPKTQKGIAGFFSKSNTVNSNKKLEKETPVKNEIKQQEDMDVEFDIVEEEQLQENDIMNKGSNTSKLEKKSKTLQNGTKKPENGTYSSGSGTKELENGTKESESTKKENYQKKDKKEGKKDYSKTKSLSEIKKNAKVDKKRKRVLQVSDSESEEESDPFKDNMPVKSDHESEDEIPPTPVPTFKITSRLIHPRKKRKIVDKTYTDEDGYILTKKEEVYESCSDEDLQEQENVEKPPQIEIKQETSPKDKKTASKNGKKKISPPQKGKQATLMNFFKKV